MTATTAENLLERFDAGEDVLDYFDVEHPQTGAAVASGAQQVSVDLPSWLSDSLAKEASRRGIARQALINTALVEWVDEQNEKAARSKSAA